MTKPQSESTALQAVWRLAYRTGQHRIQLADAAECKRLRFALYNAVRAVRAGAQVDEELANAARECLVTAEGTTLVVQLRSRTSTMLAVMESLKGVPGVLEEAAPLTPEEVAMQQSQERLRQILEGGEKEQVSAGSRTTPYYSR